MSMRALDGTVLVGDAAVVSGRLHPVEDAQHLIAISHILLRILGVIAERCREAVRAVLFRNAAHFPQMSSDTYFYDLRRHLFLRGNLFGER